MCKKFVVLCATLVVVGLCMTALADISGTNPVLVDVNGGAGSGAKPGWTQWVFSNPWTPPVGPVALGQGVTGTMTAFGSTATNPAAARGRDGGMAFVAGTGEYGVTTKGYGTHYLKLSLAGLKASTEYEISLWSFETHSAWSMASDNPNSKFAVWSTRNPADWLALNLPPGSPGEPTMGGYGPMKGTDHPVATTDTNMPAGLIAEMGTEWGRTSMDQGPVDLADVILGTYTCRTTFKFFTTIYQDEDYPGGTIDIYGWIDATDWAGSMHLPLSGFKLVPEPATLVLLGLGALMLRRRK